MDDSKYLFCSPLARLQLAVHMLVVAFAIFVACPATAEEFSNAGISGKSTASSPEGPSLGERQLLAELALAHPDRQVREGLDQISATDSLRDLQFLPRARVPGADASVREVSVFTWAQLERLYAKILSQKQIIFEDNKANNHEGDCFARAEEIARILELNGIMVAKIVVKSPLGPTTGIHARDPLTGEMIDWAYHVAPVVLVRRQRGFTAYVLDPALAHRLISEKDWLALMKSDSPDSRLAVSIVDRSNYWSKFDRDQDLFFQTHGHPAREDSLEALERQRRNIRDER